MIPARQNSNTTLRQVIFSLSVALFDILAQAASMPEDGPARQRDSECADWKHREGDTRARFGTSEESDDEGKKRGEIVIAPIPISSPAIGSGLLLGFGYVFPLSKNDKVSPPLSEEWAFAPTTKAKAV